MKILFTKKDFKRVYRHYVLECDDFFLDISKEDFNDEEIAFSNKLISLYNENLVNIAKAFVADENFKMYYPNEAANSVIEKLDKPMFSRRQENTLITYAKNTIDYDRILDIEFSGLYQDFIRIGIDGYI